MEKITSIGELEAAIAVLQVQQEHKKQMIREEFNNVAESLKPINIIKDTFRQGTSSLGLIDGILGTVAGVAVGSLSRKVFVGASSNLIRKFLGTALQFGVSSFVGRNTSRISAFGKSVAHRIFKRNRPNSEEL